jgi:hypothetical protein
MKSYLYYRIISAVLTSHGYTFVQNAPDLVAVVDAIHQSVAPVFLLTGIGAILGVLAGRLARVVDRFRVLLNSTPADLQGDCHEEKLTLYRRSNWIHRAITLCTISALLVSLVIVALFIGSEIMIQHSRTVALMFIAAMTALILGLLCFLREISLATTTIRMPEKPSQN